MPFSCVTTATRGTIPTVSRRRWTLSRTVWSEHNTHAPQAPSSPYARSVEGRAGAWSCGPCAAGVDPGAPSPLRGAPPPDGQGTLAASPSPPTKRKVGRPRKTSADREADRQRRERWLADHVRELSEGRPVRQAVLHAREHDGGQDDNDSHLARRRRGPSRSPSPSADQRRGRPHGVVTVPKPASRSAPHVTTATGPGASRISTTAPGASEADSAALIDACLHDWRAQWHKVGGCTHTHIHPHPHTRVCMCIFVYPHLWRAGRGAAQDGDPRCWPEPADLQRFRQARRLVTVCVLYRGARAARVLVGLCIRVCARLSLSVCICLCL
jgi:hypothetical protein